MLYYPHIITSAVKPKPKRQPMPAKLIAAPKVPKQDERDEHLAVFPEYPPRDDMPFGKVGGWRYGYFAQHKGCVRVAEVNFEGGYMGEAV